MDRFFVPLIMAGACLAGAYALGVQGIAALGLAAVPLVLGFAAVQTWMGYSFAVVVFIAGMVNLAFPFTGYVAALLQRL
jgi:hypothetical protein